MKYSTCLLVGFLAMLMPFFAQAQTVQNAPRYKNMTADQYKRFFSIHPGVILDVRTADEFKSGHLQGAVHMHVYDKDFSTRIAQLDREKTYYVYCKAGARSADACEEMAKLGFHNVFNIQGGINALQDLGLKLVKD